MFDQTQATVSTQGEIAADLTISAKDREILRRLGSQVAELAARPIEQEKRDLWYRLNALEPTRPVVFWRTAGTRSSHLTSSSARGSRPADGR